MRRTDTYIHRLMSAEIQFRLASAVRVAVTFGEQPLDLPTEWVHGKHRVHYHEIALRPDQAEIAAERLQLSATFLMATTMKDAIIAATGDPKNSPDANICGAYQITRMIRNAFTHDPITPVWSIDADCRDTTFAIEDIIKLDTRGLNGVALDWRHYGGPLAILRLNQYVRFEILKEERRERKSFPPPSREMVQQGDLILRRMDEPSPGMIPVEMERTANGDYLIAPGHVLYPSEDSTDRKA